MKKILLASMIYCGLFLAQAGFSDEVITNPVNTGAATATDAAAGSAGSYSNDQYWSHDGRKWNNGEYSGGGYDHQPEEHACGEDQKVVGGDCYCLYCHYQPCYYYTKRCVVENKYSQKRCCRQVPKYYEVQRCKMVAQNYTEEVQRCKMVPQYYTEQVQRCKMVPQYYTEKVCKNEPEYYYVQECTPCKKWVCERQCKYVPRYYYKKVCGSEAPAAGCETSQCGR